MNLLTGNEAVFQTDPNQRKEHITITEDNGRNYRPPVNLSTWKVAVYYADLKPMAGTNNSYRGQLEKLQSARESVDRKISRLPNKP